MKRALPFILAAFLVGLHAEARAYCFMTTESPFVEDGNDCTGEGVPLNWRRPCISISLDERGAIDLDEDALRGAIERSFGAWTRVSCEGGHPAFNIRLNEATVRCKYASFDLEGPNANTIAFADNFEEEGYDESAFAVTVVWYSVDTGEIFDADILINEDFAPYTICPDSGCDDPEEIDLENVLTHEIGHFFGLAHSDEVASTMYSLAPRGEIQKRTLHQDDRSGFCALYSEPFERSCSFAPVGGLASICAEDSPPPKKSGRCDAGGGALAESLIPLALGLLAMRLHERSRRRRHTLIG